MKNHIFTVEDSAPTTLLHRRDDLEESEVVQQQLKKRETRSAEEHNKDLQSLLPDNIPAPGIPDIKKVELYSKYRPLIPQTFQDTTCPHPGEDILDRIKSQRNKKQQQRQQQKKRKKIDSKC